MNVYLVMEEIYQDEYTNMYRESAELTNRVISVYADKEKAENESKQMNAESADHVENNNCELPYYYVEERPLL